MQNSKMWSSSVCSVLLETNALGHLFRYEKFSDKDLNATLKSSMK